MTKNVAHIYKFLSKDCNVVDTKENQMPLLIINTCKYQGKNEVEIFNYINTSSLMNLSLRESKFTKLPELLCLSERMSIF
jgi:hypothetical protein